MSDIKPAVVTGWGVSALPTQSLCPMRGAFVGFGAEAAAVAVAGINADETGYYLVCNREVGHADDHWDAVDGVYWRLVPADEEGAEGEGIFGAVDTTEQEYSDAP